MTTKTNTNRLLTRAFIALVTICAFAALAIGSGGAGVAAQTEPPPNADTTSIAPAQTAEAQEADRQARLTQMLDLLTAKTKRQETVRVIVQLRGDFKAARALANQQEAAAQRAKIADKRAALADRLRFRARSEIKTFSYLPFVALEVDAAGLEALRAAPEVEAVSEDHIGEPSLSDSVPLINAPTAWDAGYTGSGQVIAILDTGVEKTHAFLQGKVVKEACFSTTNSTRKSETVCPNGLDEQYSVGAALPPPAINAGYSHGTHVAGIAAGTNASFSGVAKDAKLIAVQIFSKFTTEEECGKGNPRPCLKYYSSDLLGGLNYVLTLVHQYDIAAVNLSIQGQRFSTSCDSYDPAVAQAFNQLIAAKVAPVVASGNASDKGAIAYPACLSAAVSVGSTNKSDVVAMTSNSASLLDLLAPGVGISSSFVGGGYGTMNGTSMATPHVAGAFAVLRSKLPNASVDQLLTALKLGGAPITDAGNNLSKPRIDLAGALNATCNVTVNPGSITFSEEGGTGQFNVTTPHNNCIWRAQSAAHWIKVTSTTGVSANGNIVGNGTVYFKVDPYWPVNPSQRLGSIKIGGTGKNATIKQIGLGY